MMRLNPNSLGNEDGLSYLGLESEVGHVRTQDENDEGTVVRSPSNVPDLHRAPTGDARESAAPSSNVAGQTVQNDANVQSADVTWTMHIHMPPPCPMVPRAWMPSKHDFMFVTGIWRDVVRLWDEVSLSSHRGVGLVASRFYVGPPPYLFPLWHSRVYISTVHCDQSGLSLLRLVPEPAGRWPTGRCVWDVRWLDGC